MAPTDAGKELAYRWLGTAPADSAEPRLAAQIHTPRAHRAHTPQKPCGCADLRTQHYVYLCSWCGAAYRPEEVCLFSVWRCYDCDAKFTSARTALQRRWVAFHAQP